MEVVVAASAATNPVAIPSVTVAVSNIMTRVSIMKLMVMKIHKDP